MGRPVRVSNIFTINSKITFIELAVGSNWQRQPEILQLLFVKFSVGAWWPKYVVHCCLPPPLHFNLILILHIPYWLGLNSLPPYLQRAHLSAEAGGFSFCYIYAPMYGLAHSFHFTRLVACECKEIFMTVSDAVSYTVRADLKVYHSNT